MEQSIEPGCADCDGTGRYLRAAAQRPPAAADFDKEVGRGGATAMVFYLDSELGLSCAAGVPVDPAARAQVEPWRQCRPAGQLPFVGWDSAFRMQIGDEVLIKPREVAAAGHIDRYLQSWVDGERHLMRPGFLAMGVGVLDGEFGKLCHLGLPRNHPRLIHVKPVGQPTLDPGPLIGGALVTDGSKLALVTFADHSAIRWTVQIDLGPCFRLGCGLSSGPHEAPQSARPAQCARWLALAHECSAPMA